MEPNSSTGRGTTLGVTEREPAVAGFCPRNTAGTAAERGKMRRQGKTCCYFSLGQNEIFTCTQSAEATGSQSEKQQEALRSRCTPFWECLKGVVHATEPNGLSTRQKSLYVYKHTSE